MIEEEPIVVLLVEDDDGHAEIIRRNFEDFHVPNRIVHVRDGQAALDYLNHQGSYADRETWQDPHFVLLDLRLPKVDGLEVLRSIKANEQVPRMPVVVLTTSDAESDIASAYRYGASSYLVKPVDFGKFTQLLDIVGLYWMKWNRVPDKGLGVES